MTADAVVTLAHVGHRYHRRAALDDVSLEVPGRCMAGLIGPDGVGKSTLLGLIAGVRRIQQGTVRTFGGDMTDAAHRAANRSRIAYMPQGLGRNLYPSLSVFENIEFFGRLFGQSGPVRDARIDELLRATDLNEFRSRPAAKLSGGMKQKLSLCCALMHDPDLLILDEPTTGVDPLSRRQFWDLINTMRSRRPQMSVIVATAYMDEAERFAWLAAIDDGRVIASGRPDEIKRKAGAATLEEAFIDLLPPEKRALHQEVVVRPRTVAQDDVPAIEAEGLTRRFGTFVAVDHVSFRIGRGEIFGFLGSNGCGKSTTMKMLTGLLPASEGWAKLFGRPLAADDMQTRSNVGYMSQAFSLYSELTVRQNLALHAELYHLPVAERDGRVQEMLRRFDLQDVSDARPDGLPLGIRQRLQLAVAVLHNPALLILDEPTSGVDPIARDRFWCNLIDLSRDDGVTIFLSTHFMNEAQRCDRISLMHAGRVLAVGTPEDLARDRGSATLEDAFVGYLADAAGIAMAAPVAPPPSAVAARPPVPGARPRAFDPGRLWAYARREATELLRDPIRLAFALLGPVILTIAFGFGISFDVEHLRFAAFDQDDTPASRTLVDQFASSRYFAERPPIRSPAEMYRRFVSGDVQLALEIPPAFGRDLNAGRVPEIGARIDGSMPFRAETIRGYVTGVLAQYGSELTAQSGRAVGNHGQMEMSTRFRYNQAFKSVNAMVPSVIMLMLILIPAVMSAVAVVREKETGSIANFRATPTSKLEFLAGKQLPYVAVAMVSFVVLVVLAILLFGVPIKGSIMVLVVGTLLYVTATTGFGQLVSTFTRTQVAAVFATAILSILPAVSFSGLIVPVSSLSGTARLVGLGFPASWYQQVISGVFAKGLGVEALWLNLVMLAAFGAAFLIVAQLLLRKQEN